MSTPTDSQLDTLRHMLGINEPRAREPVPNRDYYAATPGDPQLTLMADAGLVECYSHGGGYDWYRCTEAGRAAALASFRRERMPKPKRLYSKYLDVSDAHADLSFHEFLVAPQFADARRDA